MHLLHFSSSTRFAHFFCHQYMFKNYMFSWSPHRSPFRWPSRRPGSLRFFAAPFRDAGRLLLLFLRHACGLESCFAEVLSNFSCILIARLHTFWLQRLHTFFVGISGQFFQACPLGIPTSARFSRLFPLGLPTYARLESCLETTRSALSEHHPGE